MVLFLKTGVSPLQARSTGTFYLVLAAVAVIVAVGIALWIIFIKSRKDHHTPEWRESERNRPTKTADIKKLAQVYNLTKSEQAIIADICKESGCLNIFYSIHDVDTTDEIFLNYYNILKKANASDQQFSDFYKLRYKLTNMLAQKSKISSTEFLPEDSFIFFITPDSELLPLRMEKNTKSNFILEIPEHIYNSKNKPDELDKIRLMYKAKNRTTYLFVSRAIRYEEKDGKKLMYVAHSTKLHTQTQRQFQREFVNEECQFSSLKENAKKYDAKLVNISAGGCCIHCSLPVKEKQELSIYFPKLGIDERTIGIIRHTRIIPEKKLYALHIQFTEIDLKTQNIIYSYVYKFEY